MKRFIISIAALLVCLIAGAGTVTKNYDSLKKFNGIQICNAFQATLIQGDEYKAVVTIDTEFEEDLEVSVIGSMLYVRIKDKDPRANIRNISRKKFLVTITAPELSQINLTGTATLKSDYKWVSPMEHFTLDLSGAAKASNLRLEGAELKATIEGNANAGIVGDFDQVNIESSGTSTLFLIGNYEDISVESRGTAKVSFIGTAETIRSNSTMSSYLDAIELKVNEADIKCSGASKATINVLEKLDVELRGLSTCQYRSSNSLLSVTPDVSRASSFKRIH